jgi:anthranilate phosphoribosyltransferase
MRAAVTLAPEDAAGIARWIQRVASGVAPVPVPAVNVVAACLYATGRAADLSQAKAITAIGMNVKTVSDAA